MISGGDENLFSGGHHSPPLLPLDKTLQLLLSCVRHPTSSAEKSLTLLLMTSASIKKGRC